MLFDFLEEVLEYAKNNDMDHWESRIEKMKAEMTGRGMIAYKADTYIDELSSLLSENLDGGHVAYSVVENISITCKTHEFENVKKELEKERFSVEKRHPMKKGEMKLDLDVLLVWAGRVVATGKAQ